MDCANCPCEKRIKEIVADIEKSSQKGSDARKEIYNRLRSLETQVARTDERYISISKDLDELKRQQAVVLSKIEDLSAKPAKRWDNAISTLIGTAIGAIVTFASTRLFGR